MSAFRLRLVTSDDCDHLVRLDADPEVMRYISGGEPTSREVMETVILPRMIAAASQPGLGFFAIEVPDGDGWKFIGWAHLRRDTFQPVWAEIGYRLERRWWGQGIATAVSAQLMTRAFETLGFETVSARTMPDNLASRRVMEKLGLRFDSHFVFPARNLNGMRLPEVPGVLYLKHRSRDD